LLSCLLNLYSVYSASNVRRLCALLCPAISFLHFHVLQFHVLHFHVRHFHVLQFYVLQVGPSFSRPAISCPAHWSINFMSYNFMPCKLVRQFHVRQFHVQHFQRPQKYMHTFIYQASRNTLYVQTCRLCMFEHTEYIQKDNKMSSDMGMGSGRLIQNQK